MVAGEAGEARAVEAGARAVGGARDALLVSLAKGTMLASPGLLASLVRRARTVEVVEAGARVVRPAMMALPAREAVEGGASLSVTMAPEGGERIVFVLDVEKSDFVAAILLICHCSCTTAVTRVRSAEELERATGEPRVTRARRKS